MGKTDFEYRALLDKAEHYRGAGASEGLLMMVYGKALTLFSWDRITREQYEAVCDALGRVHERYGEEVERLALMPVED
jgi:hypothetical protein